jgi:mercuric ion transport protein
LNGSGAESKKTAITAASTGGLITALLASVCCLGPLVLAALGVGVGATGFLAGTAGFLKALLPYRPAFIGVTVLLLAVSFYLAYRKPKSAVCAVGEVCAPGAMSGSNWTLLWGLAVLALALILAPYWVGL